MLKIRIASFRNVFSPFCDFNKIFSLFDAIKFCIGKIVSGSKTKFTNPTTNI